MSGTDLTLEPWADKRALAKHLGCSIRSIQTILVEGCPHARIFGRVMFRVSEVETWLEATGRLERGGTLDGKDEMARQRVNAAGP